MPKKKFRGIDPKTGEPIVPPHSCPWYASAITAHTRLELMKAALLEPNLVIQFATDAIYSQIPLDLPRLKAEVDIKAGKEDKLLVIGAAQQSPLRSTFNRAWRSILIKRGRLLRQSRVDCR